MTCLGIFPPANLARDLLDSILSMLATSWPAVDAVLNAAGMTAGELMLSSHAMRAQTYKPKMADSNVSCEAWLPSCLDSDQCSK